MVLSTEGLSKRFRRRTAVDELSLTVERGDVYGFLGPNGAGKTTTLRMIVGLVRPTAGVVRVLGEPLTSRHRGALARVGAIIETPSLYGYLSGRDNLRMLASLGGGCPESRIDAVIERVGLTGRERDPVRIYSHGMKQRLAIAAALLPAPELILLDEPTNGLDPMGIRSVRALVRSLAHDDGLTVLLSSHLLSEVQQICNRGTIIARGKTVWEGQVDELLATRTHVRVRARPVDQARAIIERAGGSADVDPEDPGLTIVRGGPEPEALVEALVAAGCRVGEITRQTPSLEEIFVELVEPGEPS